MQLRRKATVAHGYDLIDGEVTPVRYQVAGHYTSTRHLLPRVRKEHPNFILDTATPITLVYSMPDSEFMERAELEIIEPIAE